MGNGFFPTLINSSVLPCHPRLLHHPGRPGFLLFRQRCYLRFACTVPPNVSRCSGRTIGGPEVAPLNLVAARRTAAFL